MMYRLALGDDHPDEEFDWRIPDMLLRFIENTVREQIVI